MRNFANILFRITQTFEKIENDEKFRENKTKYATISLIFTKYLTRNLFLRNEIGKNNYKNNEHYVVLAIHGHICLYTVKFKYKETSEEFITDSLQLFKTVPAYSSLFSKIFLQLQRFT